MSTLAQRRARERGLTLIEVSIALGIAAVLFAAVTVSVGAITGAKAKASASELAGVIRSLYDTAALSGKTCRLVFELADPKGEGGTTRYHAECAAGNVTTARDRDALLREEDRAREDDKRNKGRSDTRRNYTRGSDDQPGLDELLAQEEGRVENAARFSAFTAEEVRPRELPQGVTISVWTRHQREPADKGVAYLYFFPQGFTEKAHVYVRQGENVWTLAVSPLTGKVDIAGEALEVPKS
ncbi:Tfp pilus assembly protein FimT/FimU [Vitiosangium sp. GDMCC 1.1324]|uniref:pilus assembly FimT family protein n=1 Tax=Vitiosangium sp. (strain GDMCC 1.1324) TaxID=2138576 RepID=UPI000D3C95DE|nr:type II secretion system protein [Vitiosangium sp. GDMCC 1.1324]PTL80435.1 prepilin-type cleavage/methylation domain-containing protein [Vitiosangium sp. GDMCC 1.1324]